jgi:hypothetical protein
MKKAAQLVARTLEASGVLKALELMDHAGGLRVLVYHRIDNPSAEPDLDPGLISATPQEFRDQMELLAERYNVVSIRTVLAAQRGEASLPAGAVLITMAIWILRSTPGPYSVSSLCPRFYSCPRHFRTSLTVPGSGGTASTRGFVARMTVSFACRISANSTWPNRRTVDRRSGPAHDT